MDDLQKRYEPMIQSIAKLFPEDEATFALFFSLKVNREEWNADRGGGCIYFAETPDLAHVELIELIAEDTDGAIIDIRMQVVGLRTNWATWHRRDGRPVLRWPPPSVLPTSICSRPTRKHEGAFGSYVLRIFDDRLRQEGIRLRKELAADAESIAGITEAAFRNAQHSSHTEQFIVDSLRRSDQLTVSLVAVDANAVVGHVAISPVTVSSGAQGWYGLGPLSVLPSHQRRGIGSALVRTALNELLCLGGAGCVVLGDPAYYRRFGFKPHRGLELRGVPPEFFQALSFGPRVPLGTVRYHEAFDATTDPHGK